MGKSQMFGRLIGRAIWHRKLSSIVTILIVALCVGIVVGLVNVYYDMNQKMSKEFRAYGANLLIYPLDNEKGIRKETVDQLLRNISSDKLIGAAPLQYSIVYAKKKPLVLAGTSFAQMHRVSPYWHVEGNWPEDPNADSDALVGTEIAAKYDLKAGSKWSVATNDSTGEVVKLNVRGIVTTGGKEDNQIFVPLQFAQKLTANEKMDIILVSLLEKGDALEQKAEALEAIIPDIAVKPLKQLAQSEEKLIEKIQKLIYLVSFIILITTGLTVTTTMISMVMQRRKEIGLKKALGAPDRRLIYEFLTEGATLGLAGVAIGLVLAHFVAQVVGWTVFHAEIPFRIWTVPWSIFGMLIVISTAFIVPIRRIMEVEPAITLKGE